MEEIFCPRCKTTKYRNPSLRLLINTCGHPLCEACVDLVFGTRASGHCPECHITLKRSGYHFQVFQDSYVEREVEIRKRLSKEVFNKTQGDFETLKEYNNYLEFVEDIVFELLDSMHNKTNDTLVETAKKKIEQYKKDNKESILKNKGKLSEDQELLKEIIGEEKSLYANYNKPVNYEDDHRTEPQLNNINIPTLSKPSLNQTQPQIKKKKLQHFNETLLEELANSDLPADIIVKTHNLRYNSLVNGSDGTENNIDVQIEGATSDKLKDKILSSHISATNNNLPIAKPSLLHNFGMSDSDYIDYDLSHAAPQLAEEDDAMLIPYEYKPTEDYNYGPPVPAMENLKALGFLHNIRAADAVEKAGGYTEKLACHRALQEAFCGLFYTLPVNE